MVRRRNRPVPPKKYTRKVPSVMAIHKHPIHPMMVTFPIAFLATMVVTDILHVWLGEEVWAVLSLWLNVGGLGMGLLAAVFGIGDFLIVREIRNHVSAWSHFIAAVMLLALAATGVWLRWPDPEAAVWPWGLLLSTVTGGTVVVAGWLGGTLTFRHGIGVYGEKPPGPDEEGNERAAE
ncbi:MAG: DUF2231 domain-containing protein [Lysobacter spongiicola]|nr:DUF2231 domain-containing protein [Lysobacter spongiicola]